MLSTCHPFTGWWFELFEWTGQKIQITDNLFPVTLPANSAEAPRIYTASPHSGHFPQEIRPQLPVDERLTLKHSVVTLALPLWNFKLHSAGPRPGPLRSASMKTTEIAYYSHYVSRQTAGPCHNRLTNRAHSPPGVGNGTTEDIIRVGGYSAIGS